MKKILLLGCVLLLCACGTTDCTQTNTCPTDANPDKCVCSHPELHTCTCDEPTPEHPQL